MQADNRLRSRGLAARYSGATPTEAAGPVAAANAKLTRVIDPSSGRCRR